MKPGGGLRKTFISPLVYLVCLGAVGTVQWTPKRGSTYEIGSVARAEAMEIGDVDLLVEFDGP